MAIAQCAVIFPLPRYIFVIVRVVAGDARLGKRTSSNMLSEDR
jgi:hypothetical protein